MLKRILYFMALNLLVILMITVIVNVFQIRPFLDAHGMHLSSLLVFCLLWGMVGSFVSLLLSRKMAKWMLHVHVLQSDVEKREYSHLIDTVERLATTARIPMPEVGIYRSKDVNAFATGPTKNRSLVAVSSALLQKMSPKELEGVLAHEITHIANGDMVTMTLLQGVINAFVMFLARILASLLSGFGRNRNQGGGSYMSFMLFTYLFETVFMALGFLVIAAFSRYREFKADLGGAHLAGKGAMIAALQSLQRMQSEVEPEGQEAVAAFKISRARKKGAFSLFATHPPLEERIERLEQASFS